LLPGKKYTESEIKTILACPRLYRLKGSINNYDISQKFLRYAFNLLVLKLLKNDIDDLDKAMNTCVNKSFRKFYLHNNFIENEIARLRQYAFSFMHNFLIRFDLRSYDILLGPTRPTYTLGDISIELNIDAILKPKNRKKQMHAVIFYPFIDNNVINNDFTLKMKADYLKTFAASSINKNKYSEVNIHLVSSKKFNVYQSKYKGPRLYMKSLRYDEINHKGYEPLLKRLPELASNSSPPPLCSFMKCSKRKECADEPW